MCIGGGPSVSAEAIDVIRESGSRVIAVNDAYLIAPFADICYFADFDWWKWHTEGLKKSWPWVSFTAAEVRNRFASFSGQKVTIDGTGMRVSDANVFMLHNDDENGHEGLSERPNGVKTGSNGGYQAVNIATLAGAKRILLLGYDMRFSGKRSHSHNGHPAKTPEASYARYARRFSSMLPQLGKLGVSVINCTPGSLIQCFPFSTIEKELCAPSV